MGGMGLTRQLAKLGVRLWKINLEIIKSDTSKL